MSRHASRRAFLKSSAAGGLAAWGSQFGFLSRLPIVSAQQASHNPALVGFAPHIEPLVRTIEESSREEVLEKVALWIQRGSSYQEVLAALQLAGIRNVQPRPAVGFKFHAVLVVNACHLASLAGPDQDRWLPIFWAIDHFKNSQAQEARDSGWRMAPVNHSLVPDAAQAVAMFRDGMESWDEAKVDAATAGLVRTAGATEVFNLFAEYAARDFRSIGHKAIFLANAWRTLQVIGWEYAEPILRSLSFAMLNHENDPSPAGADLEADRPWKQHAELLAGIPANWKSGRVEKEPAAELLAHMRTAPAHEAARAGADLLKSGLHPQVVWDACFVGAGELLMQQPGIVAVHGLTSANALHYLYQNVADERLQQRLLLQACAFNALFHRSAAGRGRLADATWDQFGSASDAPQVPASLAGVEEILSDVTGNKMQAAAKTRAYLLAGGSPDLLIDHARRMIFLKARDAHDYKFSAAIMEDYRNVDPVWRNEFLALSVFNLRGSGDRDNGLAERTRAAVR